jgi:hypothetical protein
MLLEAFAPCPETPLVFAMDETIERRWGKSIKARGIYRDAVRSSKSFFVKCSGLRWMVMALVAHLRFSYAQTSITTRSSAQNWR